MKWVKRTFFKHRRFVDEADLEAQLAAWARKVDYDTPTAPRASFRKPSRVAP